MMVKLGNFDLAFAPLFGATKTPVIPVAIDGAYQVWPRNRKWPRRGRIAVCIGEPILAEAIEITCGRRVGRGAIASNCGLPCPGAPVAGLTECDSNATE